MEKKYMIIIAAVLLIVVIVAAAFVVTNGDDESNNDVRADSVVDGLGRTVETGDVNTIASCGATVSAMLCGIGLSDMIVGATTDNNVYIEDPRIIGVTDDDFPNAIVEGLKNGTIVDLGKMSKMPVEAVLKANSDMAIFTEFGFKPETGEQLDKVGVKYLVLKNEATLQIALDNILMLGDAFGKQTKAREVVDEMMNVIDTISDWCAKVVKNELNGIKPDVCMMMNLTYAIGPDYIAGTIIDELSCNNVFPDLGKYKQIPKEAIADRNPEVIIYASIGMGDGVDPVQYINDLYKDPVISEVDAAKNHNIYGCTMGAKNAMAYVDQGFVNAYAMSAMFIFKDFLGFDIPSVLSNDYYDYVSKFWEMIN